MKEKLVKPKTAKLAKKKGFNWQCRHYINPQGKHEGMLHYWNELDAPYPHTSRPSQSMLRKWLRDVFGIDIVIHTVDKHNPKNDITTYTAAISHIDIVVIDSLCYIDTYEKVLEMALRQSLIMIKYLKCNGRKESKTN